MYSKVGSISMGHTVWVIDIGPTHYSTREPGPVLGTLDLYLGTWTRTWEPILVYVLKSWPNIIDSYGTLCTDFVYSWSVLGNLDPYSGISHTHLCANVPGYGTHKKHPRLGVFTMNVLILISRVTIDAWLFWNVPWVIWFESGLKKIDFSQIY